MSDFNVESCLHHATNRTNVTKRRRMLAAGLGFSELSAVTNDGHIGPYGHIGPDGRRYVIESGSENDFRCAVRWPARLLATDSELGRAPATGQPATGQPATGPPGGKPHSDAEVTGR